MSNPYHPGQFSWIDLNSKKMKEAESFYSTVFGWESETQDTGGGPPYAIFKLDGKQVAGLGQMSEEMISEGCPSIWNSYVQVADCEASCRRAEELGGKVVVPAMQVMEAGTMAFLADPAGAMFAVWQADQHFGSEAWGVPGACIWNELATRDFQGAIQFYGDLFGWKFEENPDSPAHYRMILCDGRRNGGIMDMTEDWGDAPPHWTVYFNATDVDRTADLIQQNGGQIIHGPFDAPNVGRIAICSDPHGGMFNLIYLDNPEG